MLADFIIALSYLTQGLFLLFFLRAVFMFVRTHKMSATAERTNTQQRARYNSRLAVFFMIATFILSAAHYMTGPGAAFLPAIDPADESIADTPNIEGQ
jgi:hypothetical protein